MTTMSFIGIPLTPIHVGDGTTLYPEVFKIEDDALVRFDAAAVLAAMPAHAQTRFLQALEDGRLKEAQAELRKGVTPQHHLERVALGRGSLAELKTAVEDPLARDRRRGDVSPFIRTGGRPYVPGSSIKGAFRTALIDAFAHDADHFERASSKIGQSIRTLRDNQKATNAVSDNLQELALDCPKGNTERDPLRWLGISDGLLPDGATRFDQVSVGWKDGKAPKMQLHVERLWSFADGEGERVAAFPLGVTLADSSHQHAARRMDKDKTPKATLDLAKVLDAVHTFHERRWQAEIDRFFTSHKDWLQRRRKDLERELRRCIGADDKLILVRLGRFGHFESKSVDDWRRGWQAMPRPGQHVKEGATRAVLQNIAPCPLPFGWLLLCPDAPAVRDWAAHRTPAVGIEAQTAASQPAASRPGAGKSAGRQQAPSAPIRRAFVGEEEVIIEKKASAEILVRFLESGDTEWVSAEKITYR
jgi:CRISPR-associated protein Csm5